MKELFLYDEVTHNATLELDKFDLSELLSWCSGHSLQRIQSRISDEYPQLEQYLDTFDDIEFMTYFEDRYNVYFSSVETWYIHKKKN